MHVGRPAKSIGQLDLLVQLQFYSFSFFTFQTPHSRRQRDWVFFGATYVHTTCLASQLASYVRGCWTYKHFLPFQLSQVVRIPVNWADIFAMSKLLPQCLEKPSSKVTKWNREAEWAKNIFEKLFYLIQLHNQIAKNKHFLMSRLFTSLKHRPENRFP